VKCVQDWLGLAGKSFSSFGDVATQSDYLRHPLRCAGGDQNSTAADFQGSRPRPPPPAHAVRTAVTVPSQHCLGSAIVGTKTNEIPVARQLFKPPDLDGRHVRLDALHTQTQTARELVLEHGADFLLTVKDNQPPLRAKIEELVTAPTADFSP
jgi:hypothetical protein